MTFVDECRHEWKRLGVPDAVANEMAAELAADLEEAESEGASPEDVLGYAVFDARAFAAQWAEERGLIGPEPAPRRRLVPVALVVSIAIFLVVVAAGIAVFAGAATTHVAIAGVPHVALVPPPHRPLPSPPDTAGFVFLGIGIGGILAALVAWRLLVRSGRA